MDDEIKIYLKTLLLYEGIYTLLMIFWGVLEDNMDWVIIFENVVSPLLTISGTAIVTYLGVRKSQLKSNTDEINKLRELLGELNTKKNFVSMLGNDAQDKVSLSDQHETISKLITNKNIETMSKLSEVEKVTTGIRNDMQNERLEKLRCEKALTPEQIDTNKMLETLATVIGEWKKQSKKIEELQEQTCTLEKNIYQLQGKL